MDSYNTIIYLYLEKKTIKKYQTLEEFDNDLKPLNLSMNLDTLVEVYKEYTQLNETDFTFLICKIINEEDYHLAATLALKNIRFLNQTIINKFNEIIDDIPDKSYNHLSCNTHSCIEGLIYEYKRTEETEIPICFISILYAVKDIYDPDFKIDELMQKLHKLIDLSDMVYIDEDPADNQLYDYGFLMREMNIYNQNYIFKIFVENYIIDSNIKTLEDFYTKYPDM